MKVLSLFDGISCGRVALERAGIPVDTYYASEIDKYAISVAQAMYPDTIQIGDVCKVDFAKYIGKIDMIIGGSPCQDLSIAKQNRQGLRGERSGLFWKYVEALETIRPKYFLLENVASMKNEDRDAITATLSRIYPGTECIMINSVLVSAQQRKRYYWTNWHVEQPEDKGIVLKDILEHQIDERYMLTNKNIQHCCRSYGSKAQNITGQDKCPTLCAAMGCGSGNVPFMFESVTKRSLANIRLLEEKANCLLSCSYKGGQANGMTNIPVRVGELGAGGQGRRVYSVLGKSVCLSSGEGGGRQVWCKIDLPDGDYIVRKLTPRECARLQTYPERCFDVANISNTQWYKAFGNGWTVDVIAHILSQINNPAPKRELTLF